MKKKFTELSVEKMAPVPGKRLEAFDTLTPGLALRITEGGKKSWSVMYRVAGRGDGGNRGALRRMTLGAYPLVDLKAARDKARAALDLADRGDDPADQRKDELRPVHRTTRQGAHREVEGHRTAVEHLCRAGMEVEAHRHAGPGDGARVA